MYSTSIFGCVYMGIWTTAGSWLDFSIPCTFITCNQYSLTSLSLDHDSPIDVPIRACTFTLVLRVDTCRKHHKRREQDYP